MGATPGRQGGDGTTQRRSDQAGRPGLNPNQTQVQCELVGGGTSPGGQRLSSSAAIGSSPCTAGWCQTHLCDRFSHPSLAQVPVPSGKLVTSANNVTLPSLSVSQAGAGCLRDSPGVDTAGISREFFF